MQEKIQIQEQNPYFLPQILSIQEQKKRLRCPNHNKANSVCISSECLISGLMCLQSKCQCRTIHLKCHHILLDRVLQSIQNHQKQIPAKVKQTYKTIYEMINQLIEKLSQLRTKFEKQEQYFGLRQEELQFMDMVNDHKINQINGKTISSLEKTFDAEIELNKNSKQDIIKDFQVKKKEFDKLCYSIQQSYLQIQPKIKSLLKNTDFIKDSKIVEKQQDIQMLQKWVSQSFNNKQNLKSVLLFRGSQYNFSKEAFHNKCDGKKDTLVIVRNEYDKIIGGFTSQKWNSTGNWIKDVKNKSFMFSLSLKQKYKCLKPQCSIYGNSTYGPVFGDGSQLVIYDNCHINSSSYCAFGRSYNLQVNNTNKYQFNTQQTKTIITGNPKDFYFRVKQYEVYQIQ